MNTQGLIGLGLVGAALWYFSKEKEEQLEIAEDAADLSETVKAQAQEAAIIAQEKAQELMEDLPAVEAQIQKALEGAEEAINLQLMQAPLGAFINPLMATKATVIQEIRSGQATMGMERIGRRLYGITITRPDGTTLTVKAKVRRTAAGPKVVLFGAGEGFKRSVTKGRGRKRIAARAMKKRRVRGQSRYRATAPAKPVVAIPRLGSAPPPTLKAGIIQAFSAYAEEEDFVDLLPDNVLQGATFRLESKSVVSGKVRLLKYRVHVPSIDGVFDVAVEYSREAYGGCKWPSCVPNPTTGRTSGPGIRVRGGSYSRPRTAEQQAEAAEKRAAQTSTPTPQEVRVVLTELAVNLPDTTTAEDMEGFKNLYLPLFERAVGPFSAWYNAQPERATTWAPLTPIFEEHGIVTPLTTTATTNDGFTAFGYLGF